MVMNERQAATDRQFTDFVLNSRDRLSPMAIMLAGGRSQGEDLLQDALLKTYLAWGRIQPGLASAYARRTMVNLATAAGAGGATNRPSGTTGTATPTPADPAPTTPSRCAIRSSASWPG